MKSTIQERVYLICSNLKVGEITVNETTDKLVHLFNITKDGSFNEQEFTDAYMKDAKKYYPKKRPTIL